MVAGAEVVELGFEFFGDVFCGSGVFFAFAAAGEFGFDFGGFGLDAGAFAAGVFGAGVGALHFGGFVEGEFADGAEGEAVLCRHADAFFEGVGLAECFGDFVEFVELEGGFYGAAFVAECGGFLAECAAFFVDACHFFEECGDFAAFGFEGVEVCFCGGEGFGACGGASEAAMRVSSRFRVSFAERDSSPESARRSILSRISSRASLSPSSSRLRWLMVAVPRNTDFPMPRWWLAKSISLLRSFGNPAVMSLAWVRS